jgi:hypothetical protein
MAHRIIATQTNDSLGLVEEEEVISDNDQLKEILVELGLAKLYDDTKPLPPKGMNDYEIGMIYPKDRFILNSGSLYKSNTTTSTSWIASEWDLKIHGQIQ